MSQMVRFVLFSACLLYGKSNMAFLFHRRSYRWGTAFILLIFAVNMPAQESHTSPALTAFVFFQKTSAFAKRKPPKVFQEVVDEVQADLKASGVSAVIRTDDASSGAEFPMYAVQDLARASKAEFLLYVVVDRPMTKWVKVTVQCFDASGLQIWVEEASPGHEWTPSKGERNALKKLHAELIQRLAQPGLFRASAQPQGSLPSSAPGLVAVPPPQPTATISGPGPAVSTESHNESHQTVRLASGTPVRLILAETLSSRTASPGTPVKLQVMGDVKVGDLVVIANKAPGTGTVKTAEAAGRAWHAGNLLLKLQTVTLLDQRQQPLQAWNAVKGAPTGADIEWVNAVTQSYGFMLLALPFAPLQHGNQALLYKGTLIEAITDGDVLLPRDVIEKAQPKPAEPRSGPASVTVYYPDVGGGSSVDIWCGAVKVGHVHRGGKLTLTLPAARYWFRFGPRQRVMLTPLDAEKGAEQYVSVIASRYRNEERLQTGWQEHMAVVPHDVGEMQSADTTTEKSDHVLTADKLDLAQLQADPQERKKK